MSFTKNLLATAVGLTAAGATFAQQPKTITYDDAIAIALKQNIAVRQAQNAARLGDATVAQQKMQLLPDLKLSVSGSNNIGRNFSQSEGAILNQQTQALSTGLSTSLTLFDGGKTRSSIRSAQASQEASAQDLTRAKQTAVFTVASDFVALTNQREQLRVQEENLAAQTAQLDMIQRFVDAGSRPVADLYQQQAAVAAAKLSIAQASRAVELAKVDLIQALQLDPAGDYDFVAPALTLDDRTKAPRLDSLMALAYDQRADLDAQSARVDAAGQDLKAAKAARLPSISLSGSYSSAYSSAANIGFADQLDQRRGGSLGIGVSIPIFDRGSTSLATQRANLAAENERLALDATKQTIALEVRRAYLDQTSATQQLAAAEAQEAAAKQAVDVVEKRYQAGAATLVEVTQARASLVQASSAVITAKYNLLLQKTALAYYTGSLDASAPSL
jgi:outer membrane protein